MRINYVDLIKGIEDESTINIVGKINCESLLETNGDNLLYMFPLIEKMVLEIYKLDPESNVEDFKQGIMKTTNSIFESNSELLLIPENLIMLIKKYFDNDGLRNKMFHVNEKIEKVNVDYSEIHYIIMHLLSILKTQTVKNNKKKNRFAMI